MNLLYSFGGKDSSLKFCPYRVIVFTWFPPGVVKTSTVAVVVWLANIAAVETLPTFRFCS